MPMAGMPYHRHRGHMKMQTYIKVKGSSQFGGAKLRTALRRGRPLAIPYGLGYSFYGATAFKAVAVESCRRGGVSLRNARIAVVNTRRARVVEARDVLIERACSGIHRVARQRPDLVLLSEVFADCSTEKPEPPSRSMAEPVPGPLSERFGAIARQHNVYIAFGMYRLDGEALFNSLVLLDRLGEPVWVYDKVAPTLGEMQGQGVMPGQPPAAWDCDFGRIGAAICFDINFLELAERYFQQDVELVLFSSAFPAGRLLDVWCVKYGFNLAASTWYENNRIQDLTGALVNCTSDYSPEIVGNLNLDRRVVHMDGNIEKVEPMLAEYGGDVTVEDMRPEATCAITSHREGLAIQDLLAEFSIEPLSAYFERARRVRREKGGWAHA